MQSFNLWGDGFEIEPTPQKIKSVKSKTQNPKTPKTKTEKVISKNLTLEERLDLITSEVKRVLGVYANNTLCIKSYDDFVKYIDACIENGAVAIDTETNNSLDPITCKIMGLCLYTPNQKQAYIPVNHTDLLGNRLPWQVTEAQIHEQLMRLTEAKVCQIYHNGKFDWEVLKCTCDWVGSIDYDTCVAARIINENETSGKYEKAGLKSIYIKYIDPSIEKYDIEKLFKGVLYQYVDPEIFALYAATDSYMTYKMRDYQLKYQLNNEPGLIWLLNNIEFPVIKAIAQMELNGVSRDVDYINNLKQKFHGESDKLDKELSETLLSYQAQIEEWSKTEDATTIPRTYLTQEFIDKEKSKKSNANKTEKELIEYFQSKFLYDENKKQYYKEGKSKLSQLETPLNLDSNVQLQILLYNVLKLPVQYSKTSGNPTVDADALETLNEKYDVPILKTLLAKRKFDKLISTYVDANDSYVNSKTGKIHCNYNSLGADTGRLSSDEPNMQNIPSRGPNKCIRLMFKASPGCTMIGSDFSAQEPRLFATYSQDENMLNAYYEGRDLYAVIASMCFDNNYEDNLEFNPDGSPNPEGKSRRTQAKSILLGLMYGRGNASIAEQIGKTEEEVDTLVKKFFAQFPNAEKWVQDTEAFAHQYGYVEDLWHRKRRLPDIQLPEYTVKFKGEKSQNKFNPLLFCKNVYSSENNPIIKKYQSLLAQAKSYKEVTQITKQAEVEGISIFNNKGYISRAERQCVNARIQGGAASMSKKAMILLYEDKEMNDLGFKLLIMVHDELIGECPTENVEKCKERLAYLMGIAGKPEVSLPMKCDAEEFTWWYQDQMIASIKKDMDKSNLSFEEVIKNNYDYLTDEMINTFAKELGV